MKRFYKEADIQRSGNGWRVTLDGRPVNTQGGAAQQVPTRALAQLLAEEWASQGDTIDPASFPMRDMADYAIDVVCQARDASIAKLLRYAETDTLCYRADPEEPLYRRQLDIWEPLVTSFEAREGVSLERVSGIVHRPQSETTLAQLRRRLELQDAFTLAALETMASLAASLCVALAALEPEADVDELWDAADLEEQWQAELWGRDELAEARRSGRREDFRRAARFARAALA